MTYIETEAKFEVKPEELPAIRARLLASGATSVAGPASESNELLDFEDGRLRATGCALRIRSYESKSLLTYKGRVKPDTVLKKREELETEVTDGEALRTILHRLGLSACFTYTKVREILTITRHGQHLEVCLDQTPVGCFVEIEGDGEGIRGLAAEFGWTNFITKSYVQIYSERAR